ncbi:hypothetical protein EAI28_07155 [Faecalicatena contorta]|nr:hypothetical protein [Faecalicatena contorta]
MQSNLNIQRSTDTHTLKFYFYVNEITKFLESYRLYKSEDIKVIFLGVNFDFLNWETGGI